MKRRAWKIVPVVAAVLALLVAFAALNAVRAPAPEDDAAAFAALLTDLVNAYETPSEGDGQRIEADLAAIRAVSEEDYLTARSIADHWRAVYLDPGYELCLYHGDGAAPELRGSGIPNSGSHAIVVLGYELKDGRMQPELEGRCEAAAAAARAFPETILVCSGGATGGNNPDKNTEAGLMKRYLAEVCGIDPARIFIDERAMTTAENAVNTFEILRREGVRTVTIVTSAYHQRWGQALYNAVGALYRQRMGCDVEIVGNYCYDIEPSVSIYELDDRIAVRQMAGILGLPEEAVAALPSFRR